MKAIDELIVGDTINSLIENGFWQKPLLIVMM
jgi:hypothetical protein